MMAFIVWDAFDTWHLWWLPSSVLAACDDLDSAATLGADDAADALRFVKIMRSTD